MDFVMACAILMFILLNFLLIWQSLAVRWNLISDFSQMQTSAYFASESLLSTPGEPESWEMKEHIDGDVQALGLVNGRNELNRLKLEKLVSENATAYRTIKARLGLQRYEFGMRITDLQDNSVYYEFGEFSGGGLNNSLNFQRFGILDGEPVIVNMEVWGG